MKLEDQDVTLEHILATAFMVPLVGPNQHPSDLTVRWGLTLNIVGLSGIAKTQRIAKAAAALGLPLQTVFPSHRQPEDFGGVPFMTPDGMSSGCALTQANKLMNVGYGVFFVDELSTARPAVQAACLGVVDSRCIGDRLFPGKVRMLTAMNPPEYAASGFELEAPMANRLAHIKYEPPTAQEWCDYQSGAGGPKLPPMANAEQQVLDRWDLEHPQVKALVSGFLLANPSEMHSQPEPNDPRAGRAWPSPRMWEYAMCAITTVRCLGMPKELENTLLYACVGDALAEAWDEWCEKADLPHPEDMLTKGWIPDTHRLDITALSLQAMWQWLTKLKDKEKQLRLAGNAWLLLDSMLDTLPDMTIVPASMLVQADLGHEALDPQCLEAASRVLMKMGDGGLSKYGPGAV